MYEEETKQQKQGHVRQTTSFIHMVLHSSQKRQQEKTLCPRLSSLTKTSRAQVIRSLEQRLNA